MCRPFFLFSIQQREHPINIYLSFFFLLLLSEGTTTQAVIINYVLLICSLLERIVDFTSIIWCNHLHSLDPTHYGHLYIQRRFESRFFKQNSPLLFFLWSEPYIIIVGYTKQFVCYKIWSLNTFPSPSLGINVWAVQVQPI